MSNIIMNYQDVEKLKKQYSKNSLQPYSWKCGRCGEEHCETEIRNLFRRKYICNCYSSNVEQVREKIEANE